MLKIKYIAHSAFIISDGINSIAVDPFISGNPKAAVKLSEITPNYIFLSHAHGDHLGDTVEIAKNNNSTIIAIHELATFLGGLNLNVCGMNIGGEAKFPFGKVKMTIAHHSAGSINGEYMGTAVGAIFTIAGKIIYYTGDTGLFLDMKLIGELCKPDIMILPIGGLYTLGIDDAVKAAEFVQPSIVIPVHFNTFPGISVNVNEFADKIQAVGKKAVVLNYGETIEF